jgi:hypothetical protein
MHPRTAFTLVELLVVVATIVVLLALLMPALEKAVYQAELAVCAAKLKGIAGGVVVYASENKRSYPHRPGTELFNFWTADTLNDGDLTVADDRPLLRTILTIDKSLQCPFDEPMNLDTAPDDAITLSSFCMWFGYGFPNQSKMRRLGDRWSWNGTRYDWLASDKDETSTGAWAANSHPDHAGVMVEQIYDNRFITGFGVGGVNVNGNPYVFSRWGMSGGHKRGPVDSNAAAENGSVIRNQNLIVNSDSTVDERLDRVPRFSRSASDTPTGVLIPRP